MDGGRIGVGVSVVANFIEFTDLIERLGEDHVLKQSPVHSQLTVFSVRATKGKASA